MTDIQLKIERAVQSVADAQAAADHLKGDDRLHRLAMQTVFVLEDVVVALTEIADRQRKMAKPTDDWKL